MEGIKHESECIHRYKLPTSFFFGYPKPVIEVTEIHVFVYEDGYVDWQDHGYNLTSAGKRRKGSTSPRHVVPWNTAPEGYQELLDAIKADAVSRCKK